jgi:hypothetical protein
MSYKSPREMTELVRDVLQQHGDDADQPVREALAEVEAALDHDDAINSLARDIRGG